MVALAGRACGLKRDEPIPLILGKTNWYGFWRHGTLRGLLRRAIGRIRTGNARSASFDSFDRFYLLRVRPVLPFSFVRLFVLFFSFVDLPAACRMLRVRRSSFR